MPVLQLTAKVAASTRRSIEIDFLIILTKEGLVHQLDADVTEIDVVAVILEADEAFVVVATAVIEELEGGGPGFLAELAGLQHLGPLRSPEVILKDVLAILVVNDRAFIDHDPSCVPLAEGLGVLGLGGNHVVERSRLTVAINTQLGIGMVLVVENLILGSGDVDGLVVLAVRSLDFLSQIEDTGIGALLNLPLKLEGEVLELVVEDDVATFVGLAFARAAALEGKAAVNDTPARRDVILAVSAPAVKRRAVEDGDVSVLVNSELLASHLKGDLLLAGVLGFVTTGNSEQSDAHANHCENSLYHCRL